MSPNSRTKNTLLNSISGIAVRFITIITAFATRTVFIRILGIEYAGVSGVFTDVLTVLSFAEMGIGSAIVYALYRPIAENDTIQICKLMNLYKKLYTIIGFVILGLGVCLLPFLDYIINDIPNVVEDIRLIYILYLVNTASSYLLIYKSSFLTAAQKDYIVSKFKIICSIVKSLIDCVILICTRNFILYLIWAISAQIIQNILVAYVAEKEYPILKEKNDLRLSKVEGKKIFEDVKALFMYKVSGTILNGTDSLITSSFIGTSVVGILGNYNLITNQIYLFVMQIFSSTSASIGNLAVTSTSKYQENIFNRMLFLCFWIYCFCGTSLWVLLNPFMIIWQGKQYLFSQNVVILLIIDFWMKGMLSPITQFRTSNGLFVQGKYRPIIMAIINVALSIILAKIVGIAGVIIGTIASRLLTQLWYDPYIIYKFVFKNNVFYYYFRYLLYFGITVFCGVISKTIFDFIKIENDFIHLLFGIIISVFIPNIIIILIFHKTKEFKEIIQLLFDIIKRRV